MKNFKVYQIKEDAPEKHYKIFMPYDWIKIEYGGVDYNDYECVYEGKHDVKGLDDIFALCNINHPTGYRGHSLSVSDIVEMDGKMWYCNSIDWVRLN